MSHEENHPAMGVAQKMTKPFAGRCELHKRHLNGPGQGGAHGIWWGIDGCS